jgi:hypothetical protein
MQRKPLLLQVFTLGEVSEILRAPKTRIKNWTIGRPLKIIPTVRIAEGKGSRNLYSVTDVYAIALANRLSEDGFTMTAIKWILAFARGGRRGLESFLSKRLFLTVSRSQGELMTGVHIGERSWRYPARREKGIISKYILDVGSLMREVDKRVAKIRRGG